MAETIGALLTGAPATATTASTAGLFGAGGSVTAAGLISGTLTTVGVLSTLQAAESKAEGLKLQATQEQLKGKARAVQLKRELVRTIANQQATFASRGIDLSSGNPLLVEEQARRDAEAGLVINRSNTDLSRTNALLAARQARLQGVLGATSALAQVGIGAAQ